MLKNILDTEDEIEQTSTTNLVVEPSEKKTPSLLDQANQLDKILGTDGSKNEELYGEGSEENELDKQSGSMVPVEYSGSSARCVVKESSIEESELDPTTANALKLRYRIFNGEDIRMALDDQKNVWFVAEDVVKVLGYTKDTATVIKQHCRKVYDSKDLDGTNELAKKITVDLGDRKRAMIAISEPDLYRLIMRSNMPEARNFERWVVEDVLPQIRKTGKYAVRRKIQFENPEDQAKFEAAKAELASQCELFPNMMPSMTFPKPLTEKINEAKRRLFDQGHTFPNNKEFVKFLITRALEDLNA